MVGYTFGFKALCFFMRHHHVRHPHHDSSHPRHGSTILTAPRGHPSTPTDLTLQAEPNNKCHGSALHTPRWRGPPSDGVMSGAMFGARLGHPWGGDCAASCSLTLPVITGALAPPSHLAPSRSHYPSISATGASCWTRSSTQMPLTSSSGSAAASTLFQFLDIVSVSRHFFSFRPFLAGFSALYHPTRVIYST